MTTAFRMRMAAACAAAVLTPMAASAQLGSVATQSGPATVQSGPAAAQLDPAAAQPNPAAAQLDPAAAQPNPAAAQPDPAAAQPNPAAAQPDPAAAQPNPAAAQSGAATAQSSAAPSQGPMIVERVHSGFLAAPDFKVTGVDKKTSELVGGYAGWLADESFFVGGAGYWLANGSADRQMAYGGLMLQWLAESSSRLGVGVKGLIGGGQATLATTVTTYVPVPVPVLDPRNLLPGRIDPGMVVHPPVPTTINVRFREDFVVAEPEVDLRFRISHQVRVTAGAGYRFIGSDRHGVDDGRLRGATGSVALQIGGGT